MGKRVAPDERPYRPVEEALVRSVLDPQEETSIGEPPQVNGLPQVSRPLETDAVEGIPRQGILAGIQGNGQDSSPTSTAEKLSREKRVLLTLAEEREITLRAAALVAGIREVGAALDARGIYP